MVLQKYIFKVSWTCNLHDFYKSTKNTLCSLLLSLKKKPTQSDAESCTALSEEYLLDSHVFCLLLSRWIHLILCHWLQQTHGIAWYLVWPYRMSINETVVAHLHTVAFHMWVWRVSMSEREIRLWLVHNLQMQNELKMSCIHGRCAGLWLLPSSFFLFFFWR